MDCSNLSGGVLTFYMFAMGMAAMGLLYLLLWKGRK